MLQKFTQFILNRAFDKRLIINLKKKGISLSKKESGHQIYFPEPIKLRPSPSSDFSVFLQVFNEEQYLPVVNFCKFNQVKVNNILDLGANVGLTTIYLSKVFPLAKIYAIEPDGSNFKCLKSNTLFIKNLTTLNLAVWSHKTFLSPTYEEESDWGKTFSENKTEAGYKIETIDINQVIENYGLTTIDILKIDIEGAEKQVFENDHSFLAKTKVIAIEVHEKYISKEIIANILRANNFLLTEAGELIIGVNKKYL